MKDWIEQLRRCLEEDATIDVDRGVLRKLLAVYDAAVTFVGGAPGDLGPLCQAIENARKP